MRRTVNQILSLGTVGEAALKPLKLFAYCLNSAQPTSQVPWPKRATVFALQTIGSFCPSQLESYWATGLSGVFTSPFAQMVLEDTFHSGWGYASAPLG